MTEDSKHKEPKPDRAGSPPVLVPPDAAESDSTGHSRTRMLLVAACGLLLVVIALLVLCWPLLVREPVAVVLPENPVAPPAAVSSVIPGKDSVASAAATAVDELLGTWLRKQAAAEAESIAAWGGSAYVEAVTLAQECDQLLGDSKFQPAQQACEQAINDLEQLMSSRPELLASALKTATLALEQADPETARSHFERALAIDANNQQALSGLHRADGLPEVLLLIEVGLAKEKSGDVTAAGQAFTEAVALDPLFAPAQTALDRVSATIADQAYREAMSRALQALAAGRFSAARTALQQAQKLKPDAQAVRDLSQQLDQAQQSASLERLRREAGAHEQNERWPEALKACEQALKLDSQVAFAGGCRERVKLRIDLDGRLNAILARPERLFADGPLKEARELEAYASGITPHGSRLTAQLEQLTQLVRQAEAEVAVVILSDNLTDVVIYHVGRMGRFLKKELVLRTGDYTAVGTRNGFRDVRLTLKVRPGSDPVFTLRCEESI